MRVGAWIGVGLQDRAKGIAALLVGSFKKGIPCRVLHLRIYKMHTCYMHDKYPFVYPSVCLDR